MSGWSVEEYLDNIHVQTLPYTEDPREIRLIDLSPSFTYDTNTRRYIPRSLRTLKVRSRVHSLDALVRDHAREDSKVWYAISYTWGSETEPRKEIELNGSIVSVSRNLEAALRQFMAQPLSSVPDVLSFWCDALSINQKDKEEKSWQVRMMGDIYKNACLVKIWLGSGDPEIERAMQQLQTIGRDAPSTGNPADLFQWLALRTIEERPSEAHNAALLRLYSLPWWTRVWVVEEVLMTDFATFHYGYQTLRREHLWTILVAGSAVNGALMSAILPIQTFSSGLFPEVSSEVSSERHLTQSHSLCLVGPPPRHIVFLDLFHFLLKHGVQPLGDPETSYLRLTLPELIFHTCFAGLEAVNPRDKIYSLLGLAIDSELFGIMPNYTKTVQQVFTETTVSLLSRGYVRSLSLCQNSGIVQDLPSWVPDWTGKLSTPLASKGWISPAGHQLAFHDSLYNASSENLKLHPNFLPDDTSPKYLSIVGIIFDEITALGRFPPADRPHDAWKWASFQDSFKNLCEQHGTTYQTPEEKLGALLRIPITDVWNELLVGYKVCRARPTDVESYDNLKASYLNVSTFWQTLSPAGMRYLNSALLVMSRLRPFATRKGYIGMGPPQMREGDTVVVIGDLETPMILRRSDDGKYEIIGDAYVHGIMDGELMKDLDAVVSRIVVK